MARRGRFGRLPRRAPDLTGSIVAMMREYWNLQESNMVSAWREGGDVDGQPVTDGRLLDFWLERRDSVSRDDPLWDYYDNQHSQYKFSIEESKVGLQYAQKKMSAGEVARWYKGQAGNYVKDSEMYRTVMGQAARFLDAAKAQSRASNAAARSKAYARIRESTYKDSMWPGQIVMNGLTSIFTGSNWQQTPEGGVLVPAAGSGGLLGAGQSLTDLTISTGGTEWWPVVLDAINTPGQLQDWWQTNVIEVAQRQGLDLSAPFDQQDIEALMHRQLDGIDKLIAVDKKFNDVAPDKGIEQYRGMSREVIDFYQFVMTLDEANIYAQRRRELVSIISDPTTNPFDAMKAYSDYFEDLKSLEKTVGDQNPLFLAGLYNEERILLGDTAGLQPTLAEDAMNAPFGAEFNGPTGESGDATWMSEHMVEIRDIIDKVSTGDAVLTRDNTGAWQAVALAELPPGYVIIPGIANTRILEQQTSLPLREDGRGGVSSTAGPDALARLNPQAQITSQSFAFATAYTSMPIIAQAPSGPSDPATGRNLTSLYESMGDTEIGRVTYLPDGEGNLTVAVWGVYADGGQIRWTTESPFVAGTVSQQGVTQGQNGTSYVVQANTHPSVGLIVPVEWDPETKEPTKLAFNQQGVIDPSLRSVSNPTSFLDPGLAYMARDQNGRETLAGMSADALATAYQASPWINWEDPSQLMEFWRDVGAMRSAVAAAKDPNNRYAGASAEWAFYREIRDSRGIAGGLWDDALLAKAEVPGTGLTPGPGHGYPPGVGLPSGSSFLQGLDLSARNRIAGEVALRVAMVPGTYYGRGPQTAPPTSPYGPGYVRTQPTNPAASLFNMKTFDQAAWQSRQADMPAIQMGASIKVPGMPGSSPNAPGRGTVPNQGQQPAPFSPSPTPAPAPPPAPYVPPPLPPLPPWLPPGGSPWGCFIAGTLITMGDRSEKSIEEIKVGDEVLSYNVAMRSFETQPVVALKHHPKNDEQLMQLVTEEGNRVISTVHHRFYDPLMREWRAATDFKPGDKLLDRIGLTEVVRMDWFANGPEDVFNFEVATNHNYLANGYVVHNAKGDKP